MKILNAKQLLEADLFTIVNEPISSINLMERASVQCAEWIHSHYKNKTFYIFCGPGNNGGDGFAIARLLYEKGNDVIVFYNTEQKNSSKDREINLERLESISGILLKDFNEFYDDNIKKDGVFVDALFGYGLNRPLEGDFKKIINKINTSRNIKISIDLPSGLSTNKIFNEKFVAIHADFTLTFQSWKKTFLHPETGIYCGKIIVLNIGLSEFFIDNLQSDEFVITNKLATKIYDPRNSFSHKGHYGKSCIMAGSFGKIGAAVLATKAAMATGSGITCIHAPECGYEILQTTCPEAIFSSGGKNCIKKFPFNQDYTYGIGPGLGDDFDTEIKLIEFIALHNQPMVLDADALNIIAKESNYLKFIPKYSIITPHPKEFDRLFGESSNSYNRLELAKEKANELEIYIVLKDHHTQLVTPDREVYYNITGNAGLAKGGSGDVLLGIITSLLAQGYALADAAILGIWLLGKAADEAVKKSAEESLLSSEVIAAIADAFRFLKEQKKLSPM